MLTFDGVWHFGEVFSSQMNPGFHCTGQMADSLYGIVWESVLLMSTLGSSGPWWWWVGYGMGKVYVMDNETCILLMAFWMHRDTVTRSWGPLLCQSSTTITSCCSMIMHGPMLQGILHNSGSWKHPSSCMTSILTDMSPIEQFGMLWIGVYNSVFQFLPISSNFAQPWRGVDQNSTGHNQQPDQHYAKEMCCTAWGKWWYTRYWLGFLTPPITVKPHFRVAFYCGT